MKKLILVLATASLALPTAAQKKTCEELKAEIEAKIKAKGVPKFTLAIVAPGELKDAKDARDVGNCEGGAKRIVYKRG